MEGRLLLDVVVAQRAAVLELFTREDEALLVRRDALLVLDLLFHVVDRFRRLDVERDGLARQRFDEDLRSGESSSRGDGVSLVDRSLWSTDVSFGRRIAAAARVLFPFEKEASWAVADVCLAIAATA